MKVGTHPEPTSRPGNVPPEERAAVFAAYGIDPHAHGFELDHRVPLELGGSNAPENLWPQAYSSQPWNAHLKDRLEDRVHALVCSGTMSLHDGQALFLGDWIAACRRVFGTEPDASGGEGQGAGPGQG
jgi:hypothetical protein